MSTGDEKDTVRQSYDFSKAQRGKYVERYQKGSNVVVLDPDIASAFQDAKAVNDALRKMLGES